MVFITFAGLIGAGKTTIANELSKIISGSRVLREPVSDNPYLQNFYKDMKTYAYPMQIFLMSRRLEHHNIAAELSSEYVMIQDRSMYEDLFFVDTLVRQGLINKTDADSYNRLAGIVCKQFPNPDYIIYLKPSIDTAMRHIACRGRDGESNITREYLELLDSAYSEELLEAYSENNLITIDDDMISSKDPIELANYILNIINL